MTRLWNPADPIAVQTDAAGQPVSFRWRQRDHAVESLLSHWRIDTRWWARRVWRDYYELTTHTGLMAMIYHDRLADSWGLQRLYD